VVTFCAYLVARPGGNSNPNPHFACDISRKFFHDITKSTSCRHHLLPDPKSPSHNFRLRSYEKFPRSYTRTKRYCSFVQ